MKRSFEALLTLVAELDDEQARALREGLDEPTLALFDLLKKEELTPAEITRIKQIAVDLHATLQTELATIRDWQTEAGDEGPGKADDLRLSLQRRDRAARVIP